MLTAKDLEIMLKTLWKDKFERAQKKKQQLVDLHQQHKDRKLLIIDDSVHSSLLNANELKDARSKYDTIDDDESCRPLLRLT